MAKSRKQVYAENEKLTRLAQKINAKRTRLIKAMPEMVDYLPAKVSTIELKQNIKSTADFNKTVKSLERFMKPGIEKPIVTPQGIKTTEYEVKEMQIKVAAINTIKRNERAKASVSTEKGTMGTIRANNLEPKRFDMKTMTKENWNKFKQSVDKQFMTSYYKEKPERYKRNYMKALESVFGSKGQAIYDKINKIDASKLVEMYYNDPILQIDFTYDPLEQERKIAAIEEHLDNYEDYLNRLEGFDDDE